MKKEELFFLNSLACNIKNTPECDITDVLKLAQRHNILPLVYERLNCGNQYPKIQQKVFSIVFAQTKRTANFKKIYAFAVTKKSRRRNFAYLCMAECLSNDMVGI